MSRLPVPKTYKLFIAGKFPRSESGRSIRISGRDGAVVAHTCRASRKDLRNAVEAAAGARAAWASTNAHLRGQILYRLAEMLEGKRGELAGALAEAGAAAGAEAGAATREEALWEVDAATDRLVAFAGWADKFAQVLGCSNPVAGPYYNFSIPEPTGVVGVVAPDEPPLLGLISLVAPPLCAGNTIVALASPANPIPACVFAEALATSDLPAGVVNVLTGRRDELIPHFASHREIAAISGALTSPDERRALESGCAENLKRVRVLDPTEFAAGEHESPWAIEPFVEIKTIWHPSSA